MRATVTLLVLGDEGAGKTSFVYCAVTGYFPAPSALYRPPSSGEVVKVDGEDVVCHLQECGRAERWDCPGGHVAALLVIDCSVPPQTCADHVAALRARFGESLPVVLVGTKIDLRVPGSGGLSNMEGIALAKKLGAVKFVDVAVTKGLRLNLALAAATKGALAAPQIPASNGTGPRAIVPDVKPVKVVHNPFAVPPVAEDISLATVAPNAVVVLPPLHPAPGKLGSDRLREASAGPAPVIKEMPFAPPPPPPALVEEAAVVAEPPKHTSPRAVGKLAPGRLAVAPPSGPPVKVVSVAFVPPSPVAGETLPVHALVAAIPVAYQHPAAREKFEEVCEMIARVNAMIPQGFLDRPLWFDLNAEEIVAAYASCNGGDFRRVVDFPRHFNMIMDRFLNVGLQSLSQSAWTKLLRDHCPSGRIRLTTSRTRNLDALHATYFDGAGSMVFELADWASNSLPMLERVGCGYNKCLPRPVNMACPGVPKGVAIGLCDPPSSFNWCRLDNLFYFESKGGANLARIRDAVGLSGNVRLDCPDLLAMDEASDVNIENEEEAHLGLSAKPGRLLYDVVLGMFADNLEKAIKEHPVVASVLRREWTTGIVRLEYNGNLVATPGYKQYGEAEKMPPGPLYDNGYWSLKRECGILPSGDLYATMQRQCDYGTLGRELKVGVSFKYLDFSVQRPRYSFGCSTCDRNGFTIRTLKEGRSVVHAKESCTSCGGRGYKDFVE